MVTKPAPTISNEDMLWEIIEKHDIVNPFITSTQKRTKTRQAMLEYGEYVKKNTIKRCIKTIKIAYEDDIKLEIVSGEFLEIIEDLKKEL